tara:strand:+ start:361 stop:1584 length:1224 start_codon:yes stop_codon:yes gene_type:complete
MDIKGYCTPQGSLLYKNKFRKEVADDFFSLTKQGVHLSSFGIGMYKGESNDKGDTYWEKSINNGITKGINVIDTSIKYRKMRSEKVVGKIINKSIQNENIKRDQVFISTKGGLISFPEGVNKNEHIKSIVKICKLNENKLYKSFACYDKKFIEREIDISRSNLRLKTIDCYFLHNPEIIFLNRSIDNPYNEFFQLFELLEKKVNAGLIKSYGIASWNGLRRLPNSPFYLDIEKLCEIANKIAGNNHHFHYLEIPLSIGMPYTYSRLKDLNEKLNIFTSASLYEGHLLHLFNLARLMSIVGIEESYNNEKPADISLPLSENSIIQLFDLIMILREKNIEIKTEISKVFGNFNNTYISALNSVRSVKFVTTALVGVDRPEYIKDHLIIRKIKKTDPHLTNNFWKSISGH